MTREKIEPTYENGEVTEEPPVCYKEFKTKDTEFIIHVIGIYNSEEKRIHMAVDSHKGLDDEALLDIIEYTKVVLTRYPEHVKKLRAREIES